VVKTVGSDIFPELLKVREADVKAQNPLYQTERLGKLARIRQRYDDMKSSGFCTSLKGLAVNGSDLAGIGFIGKEIGSMLDKLLDIVIDNPELNKKETLMEVAKDYKGK
jgi:tRNA nucleotidyltransferase (CCA-adding enzyme)